MVDTEPTRLHFQILLHDERCAKDQVALMGFGCAKLSAAIASIMIKDSMRPRSDARTSALNLSLAKENGISDIGIAMQFPAAEDAYLAGNVSKDVRSVYLSIGRGFVTAGRV